MTRPTPRRLPVRPGPTGVADVAAALRQVFAGDTDPIAIAPAVGEDSTVGRVHAAGLTAALREDAPMDSPDAALVVATSGSTGEPTGVLLSADALATAADLGTEALGGPGYWLSCVPASGIGGILVVARAVRAGHDPHAMSTVGGAGPFTPEGFTESARDVLGRADALGLPAYVSLVPTQLRRIVLSGGPALETLAGFGGVLVGGAAVAHEDERAARNAGVRLFTTYGATETCGGVVYDGTPLRGVTLSFLDPETGEVASCGRGRILIGGPTLALGYRLRPDLTEKAFRPEGYLSPDLGECSGGRLTVTGRLDQIVKVGGVKVSLAAVSQALRGHPRVLDALTVASADPEWGVVPASYVVTDVSGVTAEDLAEDLRALVADRLGRASQPRTIEVVDSLPTSHSGKSTPPRAG